MKRNKIITCIGCESKGIEKEAITVIGSMPLCEDCLKEYNDVSKLLEYE